MSNLDEAVDKTRAPLLAVSNPGKKELLALNKILSQLLEYCAESDINAFEVSHHIKNQDIEIERLRKKLKKAKAVHN